MNDILFRRDAGMPFQNWAPFPPEAIVQVWSYYDDMPSVIGPASSFWWGYEVDGDSVGEGVIASARRLDRPLASKKEG